MIQGGDRVGDGTGDPGYFFQDEIDPSLTFDQPGRLAMANAGPGPSGGGTNGSQFFITEDPVPQLNGKHTIFGQCDAHSVLLVASIARVERNSNDKPITPVVINRVTIVREGQPMPPYRDAACGTRPPAATPRRRPRQNNSFRSPRSQSETLSYSIHSTCKENSDMPTKPGTYATFKTSEGTVVCELFEKDAPETVANFIGLAEGTKEWNSRSKKGAKLYDGTIFHRVIPQFMIQGGDPEGTGMGGPGYKFADETKGSKHGFQQPGKLAMANAGPNTNGSQFFITVTDTSWLTGKHTIFGEVVEGYDIVEKISKVSRDGMDRPKTPVVLESVTIERI